MEQCGPGLIYSNHDSCLDTRIKQTEVLFRSSCSLAAFSDSVFELCIFDFFKRSLALRIIT